jgi:hypothetical protein
MAKEPIAPPRKATNAEGKKYYLRANKMIAERKAPSEDCPDRVLFWPKDTLVGRALPGGVYLLDVDDGAGYEDQRHVQALFDKFSSQGVFIAGIGWEKQGVYTGRYSESLRNWIRRDFVFSPTVILSCSSSLFLICDEQIGLTVIGGTRKIIQELDLAFGGRGNLYQKLKKHIDSGEIGFGKEDIAWGNKYILPWTRN